MNPKQKFKMRIAVAILCTVCAITAQFMEHNLTHAKYDFNLRDVINVSIEYDCEPNLK